MEMECLKCKQPMAVDDRVIEESAAGYASQLRLRRPQDKRSGLRLERPVFS